MAFCSLFVRPFCGAYLSTRKVLDQKDGLMQNRSTSPWTASGMDLSLPITGDILNIQVLNMSL